MHDPIRLMMIAATLACAVLISSALISSALAQTVIITPDQNVSVVKRGVNPRLYHLPSARALAWDRFDEADRNRDDILSAEEQAAFRARIASETRRASNTALLATRQDLRLRHHYYQADRDKDGTLTRAELHEYETRLPAFAGDDISFFPARRD